MTFRRRKLHATEISSAPPCACVLPDVLLHDGPCVSLIAEYMGSWGNDAWIVCEQCNWGVSDIDGAPGIILCKWCFDVPFPPWWTSHSRTEHFLGNMKLLPDVLLHEGPCVSLIAEYLFEGR